MLGEYSNACCTWRCSRSTSAKRSRGNKEKSIVPSSRRVENEVANVVAENRVVESVFKRLKAPAPLPYSFSLGIQGLLPDPRSRPGCPRRRGQARLSQARAQ